MPQWAALLVLSLALTGAFVLARLPGALLIGPMLTAIGLGCAGATIRVPKTAFVRAQGIVGCVVAHAVTAEILTDIARNWPVMLLAIATLVMLQLQSFTRLFLVVAVAPLGLIGVVAALVPSGAPMGFVAILGILALIGILIRNSVILVVQIEDLRNDGRPPWDAVVEATEHRMRPILLTAAAASLASLPS